VVVGTEIKGPIWFGLKNLNEEADVAVLLASFNRPTMVVKAIESILNQDYDNWNLYILDNNSLPEVKDVLLKYRNCPRVAIYFSNTQAHERLDKYWLGAMLNIGILKGEEKFLVPLTDDCHLLPNSIEDKVDYLKKNPNAMMCFGAEYITKKDGTLLKIRNWFPRGHQIVKGSCVVDLCQTMFRRKLLEVYGFKVRERGMDGRQKGWLLAQK